MRFNIFALIILIAFAGCKKENNITGPVTNSPLSDVKFKDGVLYTLEVSKDKLGIFDTLDCTLTALNFKSDTAYFSSLNDTWSLTNDSGRTIIGGPMYNIGKVTLNPNKSTILYQFNYQLVYIFDAPINVGKYVLHLKLENGLSFEINLSLGKSDNEITDTIGIISPIFPLKVGNKWTYSRKTLFKDGTVTDAGAFSWTIIGEALIEGEKWFWLSSSDGGGYFITSRQDGIYRYLPRLKIGGLMYKYPAIIGEQFLSGYEGGFGFFSSGLFTVQMSVDSLNEAVKVPGGNFNCIKYHIPSYQINSDFIDYTGDEDDFLSNIGPVKTIVYPNRYGEPGYFWELVSTNIK
jgi:hypothetical protein